MYRIYYAKVENGTRHRCYAPEVLDFHPGECCVIQCEKNLEYGRILLLEAEQEHDPADEGATAKILRRATAQDSERARENQELSEEASRLGREKIQQHGLPMRLVGAVYTFDRNRVIFYFTAEGRVDFRDLVCDLARDLGARVELRQIGVRDEAGMIGGIGPCGRQLCCSSWLHEFASIHVRMAKDQRLSLNPANISGMCGRLKCCLRYEHATYRELIRALPPEGSQVKCPQGTGRVVGKNVLKGTLLVEFEGGSVVELPAARAKGVPRAS